MLLQGALASLALPRLARAAAPSRRFLFLYCPGGWDPTTVFAPVVGSDSIDFDEGATASTAGGLPFVDQADRPSVRAFLEAHGARTTFLHGVEVPSVSHYVCRRLICTGTPTPGADDWPGILGASALDDPLLPVLSISGLSYSNLTATDVMRVGDDGQLADLVAGRARGRGDLSVRIPTEAALQAVDAYVAKRIEAALAGATGRPATLALQARTAQERLLRLQSLGEELDLSSADTLEGRLALATEALSQGLCRCAIVGYHGYLDQGWDTHSNLWLQGLHFEELFGILNSLVAGWSELPGPGGGLLSEEVVLVVLSEMGRFPKLNAQGGKDHWTWTSAMLVGGGIAGGRVIGGYDDALMGQPVDLASGEPWSVGTALTAANLGATLLALGDVDPGDWVEAAPIEGLLE